MGLFIVPPLRGAPVPAFPKGETGGISFSLSYFLTFSLPSPTLPHGAIHCFTPSGCSSPPFPKGGIKGGFLNHLITCLFDHFNPPRARMDLFIVSPLRGVSTPLSQRGDSGGILKKYYYLTFSKTATTSTSAVCGKRSTGLSETRV